MGSSYQKFAKDVLIIGVTNVLIALSGIILLPLITKTLGAHDYGIWAQVQVTIGLVMGFIGLGLPYAMTRFLPAKTNRAEIQEDFWSVFCLVSLVTLFISIILIVAADFIAEAFFEGATNIVIITGLIILVWSLDSVFLTVFRTFRQMKKYSIFTIANTYGQIGLIAYLVLNGHGILSMVLAVLAIRVIMFPVLFFLIKSQIGIRRPHFARIKEYLNFGIFIIPAAMGTWVVNSSDRYVIGYFLGITSVGIYSAAYAIGNILTLITGILGFVMAPTLSKLYDEGKMEEVTTHLSYLLKYLLMLAIPFVFGSAILAEPVLRMFSTPEIASHGYFVVPIVALSVLVYGVCVVVTQILLLVKKARLNGMLWIIAAICNLSLNILIIPRIGILGAALTTLIAFSVVLGLGAYYSWKEFTFRIDWVFIAKSILASIIMSLAIWKMSPQEYVTTILAIIAGAAIYGAALLLMKGFKKEEFAFFKGLFRGT